MIDLRNFKAEIKTISNCLKKPWMYDVEKLEARRDETIKDQEALSKMNADQKIDLIINEIINIKEDIAELKKATNTIDPRGKGGCTYGR